MRFLSAEQLQSVGFQYVLDQIHTISRLGDIHKLAVHPFTHQNKARLIQELDNTEAMIELQNCNAAAMDRLMLLLHKVKDIQSTIRKIQSGAIVEIVELFEVKVFAAACNEIRCVLDEHDIQFSGLQLVCLESVFSLLDPDNTGFETFYIYDSYSKELAELRSKRKNIEKQVYLAETESEREQLLLERASILDLESDQELAIRKSLTERLRAFGGAILSNSEAIGYLDYLIAKASYFRKQEASRPEIIEDGAPLVLKNMLNPYVQHILQKKSARMQPIDLTLLSGVTVLTGANMGGKSVAMKSLALNVLLANCGMYVYATEGKIPIIEFLYMISDDLQSIDQGLSTFGAEMIELKKITRASQVKNGLILFDELARGTNPQEARSIVQAVIRFFGRRGSYTFISTHYDSIMSDGIRHLQVVGVSKVNFEHLAQSAKINSKEALKLLQKQMDYSIEEVSDATVPKNALQIAELLGVTDLEFDLQ